MLTIAAENVTQAMSEAVAEIIENMAFMEAPVAKDDQRFAPTDPVFFTRLPIYKPFPAMVGLVMPQDMALNLAGTMMMREFTMEDDEFAVMDVLSELANMLAGSLLTNMLPDPDAFELGLPECRVVTDLDGAGTGEWDNGTAYRFVIDDEVFLTTWEGP